MMCLDCITMTPLNNGDSRKIKNRLLELQSCSTLVKIL